MMTTDPPSGGALDARPIALGPRPTARRDPALAEPSKPAARGASTTRRTRRHAAASARIIAGGLSAAVALTLAGAMARTATDGTSSAPAETSSTARSVIGHDDSDVPAPRVVATSAAPVAASHGS